MERAISEHVQCSHTFLLGMTPYCLYVCTHECFVLPAQDTLCKHLHCILVLPLFKLLKYLVYVLVMLSSAGCMQLLCSETFKCHFMLGIAFTTKNMSKEKVLNILNDSDECVLSDSSENGSSDGNGRAITAEEVHGMHTT